MSDIAPQSDEQLELYALGRLGEPAIAQVEEHLLICAACQERLDETESFAVAMREAIAAEPAPRSWFARFRDMGFRMPAPIWAASLAALLLALGMYLHSGRNSLPPLALLQLTAVRGDVPAVEPARETDITLADAPAGLTLRVEVVDAAGGTVWKGTDTLKIAGPLPVGSYFVRLYDGSGKLLHEYGFLVTKNVNN